MGVSDMINLISSELYRMRKSICFWGVCIFNMVFALLTYVTLDGIKKIAQNESQIAQANGNTANNMVELAEQLSGIDILDVLQNMYGNTNAAILVSVFICVLVLGVYSCGAMKNLAGKGYRREEIFLAKFLVTEFGAVINYLFTALATLIGGILYMGIDALNGAFFYDFFSYIAMNFLYLTSLTAIIIFLCELVEKIAAGIVIAIVGILLSSYAIMQGLDLLCILCHIPFQPSEYWITTIIQQCPCRDIPAEFIISSGLIAGFWLLVSLIGGMLYFMKKDIK